MFRKSSPEPMAPAPRAEKSERKEQSFLQSGVKIEGDLVADGDVRIEGQLIGSTKVSGALTVGPKAELEGVFAGHEVVVHGHLKGTIHAQNRIHLARGAKVVADLYCSALIIEEGVLFQGCSNMGDKANPKGSLDARTTAAKSEAPGIAGPQRTIQKDITSEAGQRPSTSPPAQPSIAPHGAHAQGPGSLPRPGYPSGDRSPEPSQGGLHSSGEIGREGPRSRPSGN
ncbi:MAG: polymer-forming cytoskeletal protein [Candidatus Eisenbacteria bacterium]